MHVPYSNEIQMVLAIPVLVLFGTPFYTGAWKQARLGRSNMDTLVALSTSIAFLFSVFNTFSPISGITVDWSLMSITKLLWLSSPSF